MDLQGQMFALSQPAEGGWQGRLCKVPLQAALSCRTFPRVPKLIAIFVTASTVQLLCCLHSELLLHGGTVSNKISMWDRQTDKVVWINCKMLRTDFISVNPKMCHKYEWFNSFKGWFKSYTVINNKILSKSKSISITCSALISGLAGHGGLVSDEVHKSRKSSRKLLLPQ